MKQKLTTRFAYAAAFLALLAIGTSCSETVEELPGDSSTTTNDDTTRREVLVTFKNQLSLADKSSTRAEVIATADENKIAALDVYVFGSATEDGTYTFQERFAYREDPTVNPLPTGATLLEVTAGGTDNNQLTTTMHLQKGLFVKIYCVANQTDLENADGNAVTDAGYTPLTLATPGETGTTVGVAGTPTLADFLAYHSPLLKADNFRDVLQTPLPMTGAVTTPIDLTDFSVTTRLQTGFKLTRTVARFDVINDATTSKLTINSISMGNARSGVNLFPITAYDDAASDNDIITYPECSFANQTDANAGTTVGAFYSYPSPKADNGYLILKGKYQINQTQSQDVTYQVPFKSAGNSSSTLEINPNHRYTLAITAADEYHIDFNLTVADWADDGSIDGYRPEEPFVKVATVTGADETFGDDIQVAATDAEKTLTLGINSNQKLGEPIVEYEADYGGTDWLSASLTATKAAEATDYTYTITVSQNEDTDAANQVHIGYVTLKWGDKPEEQKKFTIYRGASLAGYPIEKTDGTKVRLAAIKMKDGSYWAPVNVGATKIATNIPVVAGQAAYDNLSDEQCSSIFEQGGYYFQWGRNHGFKAVKKVDNKIPDLADTSTYGYPKGEAAMAVDNEGSNWKDKFILKSGSTPNTQGNWFLFDIEGGDNPADGEIVPNAWYQKLWNENEYVGSSTTPKKTKYDPCPEGWRVPTKAECQSIINGITNIWNSTNHIFTIDGANDQKLVIPAVGSRYSADGAINDIGSEGIIHLSTLVANRTVINQLLLTSSTITTSTAFRASANPVRCIQNTGAEPNNSVE